MQQRKVDEDAIANAKPAIESKSEPGSKKTETDSHGSDKAVEKKSENENSIVNDKTAGDSPSKKDKDHDAPSEAADKTVAVAVDHGLEIDTEWTKQGVEEVLATTGVQCAYNTEVSRVQSSRVPGPYHACRSLTQGLCDCPILIPLAVHNANLHGHACHTSHFDWTCNDTSIASFPVSPTPPAYLPWRHSYCPLSIAPSPSPLACFSHGPHRLRCPCVSFVSSTRTLPAPQLPFPFPSPLAHLPSATANLHVLLSHTLPLLLTRSPRSLVAETLTTKLDLPFWGLPPALPWPLPAPARARHPVQIGLLNQRVRDARHVRQ